MGSCIGKNKPFLSLSVNDNDFVCCVSGRVNKRNQRGSGGDELDCGIADIGEEIEPIVKICCF